MLTLTRRVTRKRAVIVRTLASGINEQLPVIKAGLTGRMAFSRTRSRYPADRDLYVEACCMSQN